MKRIKVKTTREYSVLVGSGAISQLKEELPLVTNANRILVVSDDNVAPLHLDSLLSKLSDYNTYSLILTHGEENKNIETVLSILTYLKENSFDRDDLVIALGGGVVGDISAFASSIYMRGIDFINIPTTLLSQVDSSVGGKTGVDFCGAKNIVGSFFQPRLVICDTDYLKTLPEDIFSDGCAEVIKYAFIGDDELLPIIEDGIKKNIDEIVYRCVYDKDLVVSRDEFDRGDRALLNFGHTIGHAVESLSDYKVSHGKAVAIGMSMITLGAEKLGVCPTGVYDRLVTVLKANSLPTTTNTDKDDIMSAVRNDKKKSGDRITAVLPIDMCCCVTRKLTFEMLSEYVNGALS